MLSKQRAQHQLGVAGGIMVDCNPFDVILFHCVVLIQDPRLPCRYATKKTNEVAVTIVAIKSKAVDSE
jgi:hypothetical protein